MNFSNLDATADSQKKNSISDALNLYWNGENKYEKIEKIEKDRLCLHFILFYILFDIDE